MVLAAIHTFRVTNHQSHQADQILQQFVRAQRILNSELDRVRPLVNQQL